MGSSWVWTWLGVWHSLRKNFFSEEKKQKTFIRWSGPLSGGGRQPIERFLVLKETSA
jgi:hypothetical protein